MAEIKHNFAAGKMNKDVDERLVPNGQYRDAMNIQVSTSEGSNVGTIQNILGNSIIPNQDFILQGSTCIASISDEKNDAFYWFVKGPSTASSLSGADFTNNVLLKKDLIVEYKNNILHPVVVDLQPGFIRPSGIVGNGIIQMFNQEAFDAINPGDVIGNFTEFSNNFNVTTNETFTVGYKDPVNLTIDIGDLSNSNLFTYQFSGPGSFYFEVLQLENNGALNFPLNLDGSPKLITGINIVDDLLFWTDGVNEPKKINITNCKEGTDQSGTEPTFLVNPTQNILVSNNILLQEKHVTVLRKAPKNALTTLVETTGEFPFGVTNCTSWLIDPLTPAAGYLVAGQEIDIILPFYLDPTTGTHSFELNINDTILFNPAGSQALPNDEHLVSVELIEQIGNGSIPLNSSCPNSGNTINNVANTYEYWTVRINAISESTPLDETDYNWALQIDSSKNFKNKFPRFSYRYKYRDGEYSSFAPFTTTVFEPQQFRYDTKEAFNKGMENGITRLRLKDFNSNLPKDVEQIEFLYKESNSPNVYSLSTVTGSRMINKNYKVEVKPDQIKAVLPENQLLRAFDNVPRSALAQEVTANRLIYANYLQNYDLETKPKIYANVQPRTCHTLWLEQNPIAQDSSVFDIFGFKSIKSIRNYSLGVAYLDKYGRQSPVFTHKNADFTIPINNAKDLNQLSARISSDAPDWAVYYKYYIKETSNEYYNLAMDRLYDAADGNVWLAFPSSDRNKVDEETFLILKKGVEGGAPVTEDNKYKILAIANEAPDFIKTTRNNLGTAREDGTPFTYFTDPDYYPIKDSPRVAIEKTEWDTIGLNLENFETFELKFSVQLTPDIEQTTLPYRVINFEIKDIGGTDKYVFILDRTIEEDWMVGNPATQPPDTIGVTVFQTKVENRPEFDGRFFAKVARDVNIDKYIIQQATASLLVQQVATVQLPFYFFADGNSDTGYNTTGNPKTNDESEWQTLFDNTSAAKSCWFIDGAFSSGYFPQSDASYLNDFGISAEFGSQSQNYQNNSSQKGAVNTYGKGIHVDNGQVYIDLTFGFIKYPSTSGGGDIRLQDHTPSSSKIDDATDCTAWAPSSNSCSEGDYFDLVGDTMDNKVNETNDRIKIWKVGDPSANSLHADEQSKVLKLVPNNKFRFVGDPNQTIYTITGPVEKIYKLNHYDTDDAYDGWLDAWNHWTQGSQGSNTYSATEMHIESIAKMGHSNNRRVTYRIPIDLDPTAADSSFNPLDSANATTTGTIQFIEEEYINVTDQKVAEDPAIWETEPKQDIDLDIYYEIDGTFPLEINNETNYVFAPVGSVVTHNNNDIIPDDTVVVSWQDNIVEFNNQISELYLASQFNNGILTFHRPDGSCVTAVLQNLYEPTEIQSVNVSYKVTVNPDVSKKEVFLSWFNCYSFKNGVESDRIRDDFNQVRIDKGAKASSTIEEPYKEENRKYGLIYSGIYNSISGVNNLNQFITAEKITKDVNPLYGSIQKLHTRDSDLIALCEDKILKILANKDAVFNADGNTQLTATKNVLGQTVPFSGEYGISTNPESFAHENYRSYFTDKVRGSVMRLSIDGLTPISMHGMKDWFRDNLKLSTQLIGSYDDQKDEYNITLKSETLDTTIPIPTTVTFREDVKGWVSFKSFVKENGVSCANKYYTFNSGKAWMHHDEDVDANTFYLLPKDSSFTVVLNDLPGSVKSFKSINYEGTQSKINQFTVDATTGLTDKEYYNLQPKEGWYVDSIITDKEKGLIDEFIEKEGKWFNYIKGQEIQLNNFNVSLDSDGNSTFDQASFAIQGLGVLNQLPSQTFIYGCTDPAAANYNPSATTDDGSCIPIFNGCMEPTAVNYHASANVDDGSCIWTGCLDDPCLVTNSFQLHPDYQTAYNYATNSGNASIVDDGSCITTVYGCTISTGTINYNPAANVQQVDCYNTNDPCIYQVNGCMVASADNYNPTANTDDGTCTWSGCTEPLATNYVGFPSDANSYIPSNVSIYGIQDDGSCLGGGCTDPAADNYDPAATYDPLAGNGSCIYCQLTTPAGSYNGVPVTITAGPTSQPSVDNGQIAVEFNANAPYLPFTYTLTDASGNTSFAFIVGQDLNGTNPNAIQFYNLPAGIYSVTVTGSGVGSVCSETYTNIEVLASVVQVLGCTDSTACNYDVTADTDDGSCQWTTCAGCMEPTANWPNPSNTNTGISYGSQTSNWNVQSPSCITPGSNSPGPCTIQCGDGNNANPQGTYCCGYQIFGCTDPTACNYITPPAFTIVTDDGSCSYSGCTDPTALNYQSCATVDDGSCIYAPVPGCTDPNACNYNVNADQDDGSCILGFAGVTLGDPNAVDLNGNPLPNPHYVYGYGAASGNQTNSPSFLIDKIQHFVAGGYPANSINEVDIGLSIQSLDPTMAQYGAGDSVKFQVRRESETVPGDFGYILDGPVTISNTSFPVWNPQTGGAIYGDRSGSLTPPYPFGPAANASNNIEFDYGFSNNTGPRKYVIEVWSEIGGVEYGKSDGPTPNCGVYHIFEFTPVSPCSHQNAVFGCTDQAACNYDSNATCDDGSCYYGTVGGYDCVNSGPPGFTTSCQPVSCGTPQFNSLSACQNACGANLAPGGTTGPSTY